MVSSDITNNHKRRIPLEGTFNFRDLGGYRTADGRQTKWGQVYRSDNLSRLTDAARRGLGEMRIRLVCDFRSKNEADLRPDRLPEDPEPDYLHLPVSQGSVDGITAFEKIKNGDTTWFTEDYMRNAYMSGIEQYAGTWGRFIRRLASDDARPVVFHCSAGKDRAGIAAALVLSAVGVPEETVIYDHQLSNQCIAAVRDDFYRLIRSYGVDPSLLADYFSAPHDCITAVLAHIRCNYGTTESYLTSRAGVDPATLGHLRSVLLQAA